MLSLTSSNSKLFKQMRSKKLKKSLPAPDMNRVAAIILSGGEGTRLFPLTLSRCKPAISFGGRYRLIDIPISNSLNSGCHKIFVVTQFLSASLHQHVFKTYRPDSFHDGFLELLSAEQKPSGQEWFKGTADAVRKNLQYLSELSVDYFLILSGDQLYSMDYREMVITARETNADLVVATLPVKQDVCKRMGILKTDSKNRITHFVEKPQEAELLKSLQMPTNSKDQKEEEATYLGSMGIYLFKREALFKWLQEDAREDFGKHLLPTLVERGKASAYLFDGYWEDIGTIESFYNANIALTISEPFLDCYDERRPIYSNPYHLAGPKIINTLVTNSIICEGSRIQADEISSSILGPRTVVHKGTVINKAYVMGNDYYRPPVETRSLPESLHIGKNCIITKAIIDKNVYIGDNVRLINKKNLSHYDGNNIFIRDGIIIVPRGASIPDGFIL
ncbi:MAG: sugar phosphate nucleotidyltransferase [Parachlamydiaceae bacterium]